MTKGKNKEVVEEVVVEEQPTVDSVLVEETVADDVVDEITELDPDDTFYDLEAAENEVLVECLKNTSIPSQALVKGEKYLVDRADVAKLLKHGMVKEVE